MSAAALFISLLIIILLSASKLRHSAMPLMLSLGFWGALFFFYVINPVQFIPIGIDAFVFMLCCFCLYASGYYIGIIGIKREFKYHVLAELGFDDGRATKAFLFFLFIFLLIFYFRVNILKSQLGNIIYLINDPYLIREESVYHGFDKGLLIYILEQFILPASFFIIAFINKSGVRFKIYAIILFMEIIMIQLTTMSRGLIIYSILVIITLYLIQQKSNSIYLKRIKNVTIIISVSFVFLFSINLIRSHEGAVARYSLIATSFRSWVPDRFINNDFFLDTVEILRYINCGIYGFAKYTEKGIPESSYRFGAISFSGALKLLTPFNIVNQEKLFSVKDYELVMRPTFTVVYTFFREQYEDFGLIGTLSLHFLWGLILGLSFRKYLKSPSYRGLIIPATLTVWYMYGAFVMQTVFTISFTSPFIAYLVMTAVEKRRFKTYRKSIEV